MYGSYLQDGGKAATAFLSREGTVTQPTIYARPPNDYEKMVEALWQMTDFQTTGCIVLTRNGHCTVTVAM